MNPISIPRRTVVPFLAAGALFLVPAAASAASVEPSLHADNPSCLDRGYSHELKFDPPSAGSNRATESPSRCRSAPTRSARSSTGRHRLRSTPCSSRAAPDANAYTYPGESSADTGLHAPFNGPDSYYGPSHVSFCWDDETPPPPNDDNPPPPVVETPPAVQPPVVETPPTGGLLGEQIVAGRSRLAGPSGCAGKTVKATVKGSRIAKGDVPARRHEVKVLTARARTRCAPRR